MANKNNFNKIKFWEPNKLRGLGERYKTIFIDRVEDQGKDYRGKQFPRYSKGYAKLLAKDFRKKDGGRYKGFEGMALTTGGSKVSKRQFKLRGLTIANFRVKKVTTDTVTMGWTGEAGAIVDGNAKKGRNIIDGIPSKELSWWVKELGKLVDREYKKIPPVINLGR